MAKKKRKSLLQSQREKLARQRAARRAAQRANQQIQQSIGRSLPARGRTTATSPRARVQRGLTRDRLAKQQLQNFGRALQRTMKQRQAQNKLDQAAKGTKGGQTRTAGGAGQLARRGGGSSSPTSQRIQPVRVRVDGQKQLPAGKKSAGQLPAKTTQKTQPVGKASARRAQAAARQARAAQGSKGPNRVGQPAGAANRYYGKKVVDKAVQRAQQATAMRSALNVGKGVLKGASRLLAGRSDGSENLLLAASATNDVLNAARGSTAKQRNARKTKPKQKETEPKRGEPIRNRRGRVVGYKPVQPARRGMSNLPSGYKEDEKRLSQAARPKTTKPASGNGGGGGGRRGTTAPASTPQSQAYAKDARNKEYDRLRKAGKTKEAEALGKKIAADARKKAPKNPFRVPQGAERKDRFSRDVAELKAMGKQKKKKKQPQSAANKKGWQGNRNY